MDWLNRLKTLQTAEATTNNILYPPPPGLSKLSKDVVPIGTESLTGTVVPTTALEPQGSRPEPPATIEQMASAVALSNSTLPFEALSCFYVGYPWLRDHLDSLLAAGWTRRELFMRGRYRWPYGDWGRLGYLPGTMNGKRQVLASGVRPYLALLWLTAGTGNKQRGLYCKTTARSRQSCATKNWKDNSMNR